MSRRLRTKDCVPAGTLAQLIAGDVPSPGAAPGAAWLNFTGIWPPSGNPVTVNVMAGPARRAARRPRFWAVRGIALSRTIETTNQSAVRMLFLLKGERVNPANDIV